MAITKRQKEILGYLEEYLSSNGYGPTLEEIACHFELASLNGVHKHLKALEERGFIRRLSRHARSIQLLGSGSRERHSLPLLGYVAAGQPIEAIHQGEEVSVPDSFLTRNNNYILKVRGDSMIDEHIQDGDYVIVDERSQADEGELVIALVDQQNVTLKKYYREGREIRLQPANSDMEPIYIDESRVRIQGIVVGIIRKY